ncbi:hypothetical protein TNCV_1191291 [Trichonephila clavipes]|nr:hypothetical protein TNCV_1191291 [Trichonephila clavipes]
MDLFQGEGVVTSSMVVNSHLSIHNRFYGFTSWSRTSTTSSIVPAFLRSNSCGMTSARGHGAIVYCLNSGSEDRQTGRHNGKERRKESRERRRKEKTREKGGDRERVDGKREERESGRERAEPALYGEKG